MLLLSGSSAAERNNYMDKLKWGIIGAGRIADTFCTALKECGEAEVISAASRNIMRAKKFADKFNIREYYSSGRDIAVISPVDAVYIATPMSSHYEYAKMCIENGKNVLCEKSVTLNSAQLSELLALAEEKGVFFMEAMWMKCRPVFIKAKEWADSGRIGEIRSVRADFSNLVKYDPYDRLFKPESGGGSLLDMGVYPLTLADSFLGEPSEIISNADISEDIDMSCSVLLRYPSGAFASVYSGFSLPSRNNAVITGTKGSIVFGDCFFCTDEVTLYDAAGETAGKFTCKNEINGYEYEIREFSRCIREGVKDSTLVPHSGTVSVMKVMDECRRQWGLKYPNE